VADGIGLDIVALVLILIDGIAQPAGAIKPVVELLIPKVGACVYYIFPRYDRMHSGVPTSA